MPQGLAPKIAFCITCKARTQHLELTLTRNLIDNARYPNAVFVLLNYNSPDHLMTYLLANHRWEIETGKIVVYSFTEAGPFHMAHAKNMAHRLGIVEGADILVNLDADNFTGRNFAGYIASKFYERENVFLWARMIQEGQDRLPRGCNGRIVVSSQAFMKAGGYDEKYNTWSPDDKDFNARLQRLGYTGVEIDRQYLCDIVLHSNKMRFREYPHAKNGMGSDEFDLHGADNTVVNCGRVGTGVVFKNLSRWPIDLPTIPTRIFGIGMHKTATSSLHAAFNLLNFDSGHWENAHWAKAIWTEMTTLGRSRTLENYYALSDLPIPVLYRELDRAYPGSKFVLTTRTEERWLRSVEKHWSGEHNRFRGSWDTDPFTHRIHQELYGQKHFDAEVFLARFRRHNAEVKAYFKHRPHDLLEMDMDLGAGWLELCGFLGTQIPAVPYPRTFATLT